MSQTWRTANSVSGEVCLVKTQQEEVGEASQQGAYVDQETLLGSLIPRVTGAMEALWGGAIRKIGALERSHWLLSGDCFGGHETN